MSDDEQDLFEGEGARNYEANWARLAAMKQALDLFTVQILGELGAEARILVVGAGTGSELLAMAEAQAGWRFTAVEPSADMLRICRERVEEQGLGERVAFHEGFTSGLSEGDFDGATSILVSHFLVDPEERRRFFSDIHERLRPGGLLVSAEITAGSTPEEHAELLAAWRRMLAYAGLDEAAIEAYFANFGTKVGLMPPAELGALIASVGFALPQQFFQTLLVRGTYARRS